MYKRATDKRRMIFHHYYSKQYTYKRQYYGQHGNGATKSVIKKYFIIIAYAKLKVKGSISICKSREKTGIL
jgi:hypothetical protein